MFTPTSTPVSSAENRVPNGESAADPICRCGLDAASDAASTPAPAPASECQGRRVRLTRLRVGETGRVCGGRLEDEDKDMLRALGLRPDALVKLTRTGEPCIVQVLGPHGCSCRIGLARPLAERVIVSVERKDTGR